MNDILKLLLKILEYAVTDDAIAIEILVEESIESINESLYIIKNCY